MTLPKPAIYNLATDYARFGLTQAEANRILDNRFENRQGSSAKYIVLHIQAGSTVGSLDWWANGPGVQASSTVLAQKDGSILNCIPEQHGPWTNGDVNQPLPEAADLIAEPGNPNLVSLTVEAEGWPFAAMPQAQLNAIAWQCMEWMRIYNIPIEHIERHGAINSVDRPNCGLYIDDIKAIIVRETAAPPSPQYPDPLPLPDDMYPIEAEVLCIKTAVRRQYGESDAPKVGPNVLVNTTVKIIGEAKNKKKQQWFFLEDHSRVRATSFTPSIQVKPR